MEMRKNYFAKLVKYTKNVYDIERGIGKLKDGRISPTHKTSTVILVMLFGLLLRIRSFNELNYMIKENEFKNLFPKGTNIPRIDTIRDSTKVAYVDGFHKELEFIVKKSVRNKVFDNGTIDGYTVVAIDGTKLFGSNKKSCLECLRSNGHNFHSCVAMSTVGDGPKLVVEFEMYKPTIDVFKKDEGEITAAKRLVSSVFKRDNSFIDVIVYDSLVCNSIWINHCLQSGFDLIVRAKNNKNNSIRQVKKKTNKQEPAEIWSNEKGFEKVEVFETEFNMPNVEQPLRFVKFAMKHENKERTQIMIVTTCMDMSCMTLFKIIRARWDIENSIFNNLKTECALNHCFVHGGNSVEVMTAMIFIASNFMQLFYYRRIKESVPTQRELAQLLLKGLYFLKYKKEYVFSSS